MVVLVVMGCESAEIDPTATSQLEETAVPSTQVPTTQPTAQATEMVVPTATAEVPVASEQPIWHGRVFYEIFVRSFYDSDGDGIGDFNGITEKLDYLNDGDPDTSDDLGITGIWLMPMMESHSYHGYDVTDYLSVEQDYGSLQDFQRLLDEAHKRGIVVIIDLVLNHSSSRHPWFIQSAEKDSPFRDFYVWREDNPQASGWHEQDGDYYYGIFWEGMPDLNYQNDVVTTAAYNASKYWLDLGVDGFRLDAIKFLIESEQGNESTSETYAWFEQYNAYLKSINQSSMTVGEIWSGTPEIVKYVETDGVDLAFEFTVAEAILSTARGGSQAVGAYEFALESFPDQRFATFITNHDQPRIVSSLFNDVERGKLAASILLTSPGVPFLYYGEEIGMEGKKTDELIRTPMQWSSAENGGFSSVTPWQPLNRTWDERNVALQTDDPDSILSHYRKLIGLRTKYDVLGEGNYVGLLTDNLKVHAHIMQADEQMILVVVNSSREPISDYGLSEATSAAIADWQASSLLGEPTLLQPDATTTIYKPLDSLPALSTQIILLEK